MIAPAKLKLDNVEKVRTAWGNAPDWVIVLAEACNLESQVGVARRVDYSASVVNAVLSNSYQKGDIARFEQAVRGALMAETVICPAKGDLPRNACLSWQKKPFDPTNSGRVRMYHACRAGCVNSRISSNTGDE